MWFLFFVFAISTSRSLNFEGFSTVFKEVSFSCGRDIAMSRQVLFPLSLTAMSDLFALMSLFVWTGMSHSHCVVFSYGRWPMLEIFVLHFDAIVLITSAEREVKDSRRSGMYQS